MTIKENITLPSLVSHRIWQWLSVPSSAKELSTTLSLMRSLSVRAQGPNQTFRYLSGGNQQKVVLAKWLTRNAQVIIFDEPTVGIDVGSKVEIYRLILDLAHKGAGVILISSDLDEVVGLCDRVLVMREGRIVAQLVDGEINKAEVLHHCFSHVAETDG